MDIESIAAELAELSDADLQGVVNRILPRVMTAALARPATTLDLVVTLDCNLRCDSCGHTRALAEALQGRPEVLECGWGIESPMKACCGEEPPCSDLLPVGCPE